MQVKDYQRTNNDKQIAYKVQQRKSKTCPIRLEIKY